MNKCKIAASLAVLVFTIGAISISIDFIQSTDRQQYRFDTQNAALIYGISQEANEIVLLEDLPEYIILSLEHNGSLYFIGEIPFSEYGMDKDYVYVAAIRTKEGKFIFDKLSPDLSLNTLGDVHDEDYTPNATFYFDDIDGLYFAVGKVYDTRYKAYSDGESLPLLDEDIYTAMQEKERPRIDVVWDN